MTLILTPQNQNNMKRFFAFIFFIPVIIMSCHLGQDRIKGNGSIKTETRATATFSSVDVNGNIDLYVKQDATTSVRVVADDNLMEYIITTTAGDRLIIEPKDGVNLSGSKEIKVYVSSPVFNKLEASGACSIIGETIITATDRIDIVVTGASDARLELKAPVISADMTGASNVILNGATKEITLHGSGASGAKCFGLLSERAHVEMSGASNAEVFASVSLDANASGASDIRYRGIASHTGKASGASSVKRVD